MSSNSWPGRGAHFGAVGKWPRSARATRAGALVPLSRGLRGALRPPTWRPPHGPPAAWPSPPADPVFWKKPGAGPSAQKRSLFPDSFGHRVSKNDVCFWAEGAEVHFLFHRARREMHPKRKSPFWPTNKMPPFARMPCAYAHYLHIRPYTKRWEKPTEG